VSVEFWVTSLVVVLVPGTGVIYTISSGITGGFGKSVWAAFGCTLGIVPHILASLLGLSALLNASALAFEVLKYLGVAYLLFLAWQMWNDRTKLSRIPETKESGGVRTFGRAVLMNILNPKLTIFFLAFLPQFVSHHGASVILQMVLLSLCFMALTLLVFLVYGALATKLRDLLIKNPKFMKIMNRSFAGTLAFFGIELALSEK